jgi:carboxyl-terminal processing protease
LLDHHLDTYAVEEARVAYLLADDKNTFRQQPWVDDLVKHSAVEASKAEDAQQWVTALRLYTALIGLEPANPAWKVKHKAVFRRARLLSDYAPDRYEQLLAAEQKESDVAATIIKPSTQPSAASIAATQPDDSLAVEDNFRLNWHDLTRGIELDTLGNALRLAEKQYYRNIDYQTLLEGGLIGIKAVATTDGLDDTFTGLRDKENRAKFIDAIDACVADAHAATPDTAEDVCFDSMQKLIDINHKTVQLPDEVFVREFADGAFAQLDPFSTMTWPFDMDELEKTTQGEFGGVGIRIEVDGLQKTLKVVTPVANTPARKAGIKPGGIITRINGKSARGITVEQAVKTITGVPGSTVTLTIRDLSGVEKDYLLRREVIKNPSVEGFLPKWNGEWNWFVDPDQKIATIRLNQFSKNTAEDLGKALDQIKSDGARGVILDLRANPGGLLQSATEIVNKFISDGVIVSTHADRPTGNPPTEADAQPQGVQSSLPMVVLINQYSASASEIVSGALQDHKRAILIGERSFGKGSVQMLFQLDQDKETCLRLTTSHYYLPSGRCIHREENSQTWGVDPDVTVDLTPEQMSKVNQTREDMDVLPEPGIPTTAPDTEGERAKLLNSDPQLAAAVLVLRLELEQGKL